MFLTTPCTNNALLVHGVGRSPKWPAKTKTGTGQEANYFLLRVPRRPLRASIVAATFLSEVERGLEELA